MGNATTDVKTVFRFWLTLSHTRDVIIDIYYGFDIKRIYVRYVYRIESGRFYWAGFRL